MSSRDGGGSHEVILGEKEKACSVLCREMRIGLGNEGASLRGRGGWEEEMDP